MYHYQVQAFCDRTSEFRPSFWQMGSPFSVKGESDCLFDDEKMKELLKWFGAVSESDLAADHNSDLSTLFLRLFEDARAKLKTSKCEHLPWVRSSAEGELKCSDNSECTLHVTITMGEVESEDDNFEDVSLDLSICVSTTKHVFVEFRNFQCCELDEVFLPTTRRVFLDFAERAMDITTEQSATIEYAGIQPLTKDLKVY